MANQDVSKAPKVTFSGRVVDSDGRAVSGADLWLYVGMDRHDARKPATTRTRRRECS